MRIVTSFILAILISAPAIAQESPAAQAALDYIASRARAQGLAAQEARQFLVTDEALDRRTGITHVYLAQHVNGIPIVGSVYPVAVTERGEVESLADGFLTGINERINTSQPELAGEGAIASAEAHLATLPEPEPGEGNHPIVTDAPPGDVVMSALGEPDLVYQLLDDGALRLAWRTTIESSRGGLWETRVDAVTGEVLEVFNLVVYDHFPARPGGGDVTTSLAPVRPSSRSALVAPAIVGTYNVIPIPAESPNHGVRQLVSDPDDPTASQLGWHDTGSTQYTVTRGNNVHAYTDVDANNSPDPGSDPDGGTGLVFDFVADFTMEPQTYRPAAVTNLFYWNNIVHDVMYHYGFDEASGNFQVNNFGQGGLGNDDVRAEAQDGSGTNNANFGTPVDGFRPRMQMYRWLAPPLVTVNPPSPIVGEYEAGGAVFGPALDATGITGNVVLIDDGTGTTTDGCEPLVGFPADNIALLDRGQCNFTVKVSNAQDAGAIAVIVANNVAGPPITMGGDDASITIPSVMISLNDGDLFKANLPLETTLAKDGADRDSDFDSGIIAHEYGHGISNRLTGGPGNVSCLNNAEQMGEGWSDFFGLVLTQTAAHTATTNRGVGTYVTFQETDGIGIRPAPYTTDFAVNGFTYGDIGSLAIPHGVGFVWATMLWEMTWGLINAHGFDPDIYNSDGTAGNQIALNLVMEGLKLQPCSPGFVDGRDAILQADALLYDSANTDIIWQAFALRGLGIGADQGSSNVVGDETEDFEVPSGEGPVADVTPASFTFELEEGDSETQALTLGNTGTANLDWSIVEAESALGGGDVWSDNFDSYTAGSDMHGQGGWKGWDNDPTFGALVSDAQANSSPHSVEIAGSSDLVREFTQSSGQWEFTAWQYIPGDFSGLTYFILLSDYTDGGPYSWTVQVNFDGSNGLVSNDGSSGGTLPMITDEWVEIRVVFDLDNDTQTFYYGGDELYSGTWTGEQAGGGSLNFGAVDLYANSASSVYYDDFSFGEYVPSGCEAPSDVPWLSLSATSGTTPPAGSQTVDVTVDATGLADDDYSALLCVTTNDPAALLIEVPVSMTVGAIANEATPEELADVLGAPRPNPVRGTAAFAVAVENGQNVSVEVFDVTGRRVQTLFEGSLAAGKSETLTFDAAALPAGVYVIRATGEDFVKTRRVTVVR